MGYYSKGLGFIVHSPCGGVNVAANRTSICPPAGGRTRGWSRHSASSNKFSVAERCSSAATLCIESMICPHAKIESALDRWSECHWHIHQMEASYHLPAPFRYSLNSFIRSVKEIPQLLKMELQNDPAFRNTYKPLIDSIRSNALLAKLSKQRDFIVHQGMLDVLSTGQIGTNEGRGAKIAFGFRIAPHESSDEAYERFKELCRSDKMFRGMSGPDCDSRPCIWREWKSQDFPDTELLELAISAWRLMGEVISRIVVLNGGEELDLTFSCRHDPERVKMKVFSQADFFLSVDGISLDA